MTDSIGTSAGVLWQFLQQNGPSTMAKVAEACSLDSKTLQRAIGWLAREDKIDFVSKGRSELITLK
ncbi:winged helix-turn-helix domain-containing protein [Methylophaga sp. OBS3]|uniref:winged helix-turn-helix domain-containing protein n=1 Tax=Methylophaga sp. OBS3 TaxID=2991934 RepID=UPI002250972B|nr:winged helix-turn-helix domain-containing protein [Methylophaga sp. OBS3]MCX4190612.1 winged helix-turn-helix domain-containing protein [Methylophaga sp. OBS3]